MINDDFACYCYFDSRLSFSPDGSLLIVPTGTHRHLKGSSSAPSSSNNNQRSYATHVFVRDHWQTPTASLIGAEEPSVGVRFCPKPFQLIIESNSDSLPPMFHASYRWLYAVITIGSIYVYDTQHFHPLFKVSGIHYAAINDIAWSADGRMLVACSSDGYLTFIRFTEHALGDALSEENVPDVVKRSHPALYPLQNVQDVDEVIQSEQADEPEAELKEGEVEIKMDVDEIPEKDTTVIADADDSLLKKRKRIQPVRIASLSPIVVNATMASSPSITDTIAV